MTPNRRRFLQILGAASAVAAAGTPFLRALAAPTKPTDDFFIFVHVAGGWDVMLCLDPRNEERGIIEPPATDHLKTGGLKRWVSASNGSFQLVRPSGSNIVMGPTMGDLTDMYDRLTVVNGIAMNTVSHPDGTYFAATGQHLSGSRAVAPSIDVMVTNEFGLEQLFPVISARFPSAYVGSNLDRRATPLLVDGIGSIGRSLKRSARYESPNTRDSVTALLTEEAKDLAVRAQYPDAYHAFGLQYDALRKMLKGNLEEVFDRDVLKVAYPNFNYTGYHQGKNVLNAAFAVEALKRNIVRTVSFALTGYDTHNANYYDHAMMLQEAFDMTATLIKYLDATPHPTKTNARLSDHTHIMLISEFCRMPQLNASDGRDHYPNNSALVISPRWKPNSVFGKADDEQLLSLPSRTFSDGERPIGPADVLATVLGSVGVDPKPYVRDGEVMQEMIKS